jgi:exopolyphosphatase / guanosine-5'-triphosphate,3'-diphosphate pyrophosphatase
MRYNNRMIVAAIDIGTNSIKMVIGESQEKHAESQEGHPEVAHILFDGTKITRLGKGIAAQSGDLLPDAVALTLSALAEFGERARLLGALQIHAVGTSALRDAGDKAQAQFITQVKALFGDAEDVTVEIISGDREAYLTYLSARQDPDLAIPKDALLVTTDGGGGSTEVVIGDDKGISYQHSLQLGAVRLTEQALISNPPTECELAEAEEIAGLRAEVVPVPTTPIQMVASGGTAANLAAMALAEKSQDVNAKTIHGVRLTKAEIIARGKALAALPWAERRETPGLEPARADVIVAGILIQLALMERLGADSLIVSARGLRYGLLYEMLGS